MSSGDAPREKFKKEILEALKVSGFTADQLGLVLRALDDRTTDVLFTRATTSATAAAGMPLPLAARITEWYVGDAAKAFAAREKAEGGVQVHGSVFGPVTGRDIVAGQVTQTGVMARDAVLEWADQILSDLQTRSGDVGEGKHLRDELASCNQESFPSAVQRFVVWAKGKAVELTSLGLSALSVLHQYLERLNRA